MVVLCISQVIITVCSWICRLVWYFFGENIANRCFGFDFSCGRCQATYITAVDHYFSLEHLVNVFAWVIAEVGFCWCFRVRLVEKGGWAGSSLAWCHTAWYWLCVLGCSTRAAWQLMGLHATENSTAAQWFKWKEVQVLHFYAVCQFLMLGIILFLLLGFDFPFPALFPSCTQKNQITILDVYQTCLQFLS